MSAVQLRPWPHLNLRYRSPLSTFTLLQLYTLRLRVSPASGERAFLVFIMRRLYDSVSNTTNLAHKSREISKLCTRTRAGTRSKSTGTITTCTTAYLTAIPSSCLRWQLRPGRRREHFGIACGVIRRWGSFITVRTGTCDALTWNLASLELTRSRCKPGHRRTGKTTGDIT